MTVEDIQKYCRNLPGATEDIKWENHLCFCVSKKMFLILGMDEIPITASFKVNDDDFEKYASKHGFAPAPYLARYKWIWTSDIGNIGKKELEEIILNSYQIIRNRLSKKIQSKLV